MSTLEQVIQLLNKEEVRHLKLFLKRTNPEKDRKDVALFDLLRKSKGKDQDDIIQKKLYGTEDKNNMYRLRNRLLEDVGKSLLLQYYSSQDQNQIMHHLVLSRHFRERSHFKPAYYYLNKAEKKAKQISSLELLDIIYSDFIRLSHETLSIDPEVYINKRSEIRKDLNRLRQIDDALALLIYRIKRSQNLSQKQDDVIQLLQNIIDDFSLDEGLKSNPVLRFRIYHAVSRILLQEHNYPALETYLLSTMEEFTREQLFNKNNHETKLQMLTYLVNALYKNGKYKHSLEVVGRLHESMEEFDRMLYDKYLSYYFNSLVINQTVLDKQEAINILKKAIDNPIIKKVHPQSRVVFFLNLALFYFDEKLLRKASRSIVSLKLDDTFNQLDQAFKLKIGIVELIVRFELEDYDFLDLQISTLRKQFDGLLKEAAYTRQRDMISILEQLVKSMPNKPDEALERSIDKLIQSLPDREATDSDVLNYNEWLRGKVKKRA